MYLIYWLSRKLFPPRYHGRNALMRELLRKADTGNAMVKTAQQHPARARIEGKENAQA